MKTQIVNSIFHKTNHTTGNLLRTLEIFCKETSLIIIKSVMSQCKFLTFNKNVCSIYNAALRRSQVGERSALKLKSVFLVDRPRPIM